MTIRNQLQLKMNQAQMILEQARMKEQHLIEQIRERYIIDLAEVAERYRDRAGHCGRRRNHA